MGSDWPDWLRWRPRTALRLSDHPIERGTWSPSWTRAWTQKARGGTASSDQSHRSVEPARNIATTVLAPPDLRRGRPHCPRAPIDFATTITGGGVGIANRPRIVRSANVKADAVDARSDREGDEIRRRVWPEELARIPEGRVEPERPAVPLSRHRVAIQGDKSDRSGRRSRPDAGCPGGPGPGRAAPVAICGDPE